MRIFFNKKSFYFFLVFLSFLMVVTTPRVSFAKEEKTIKWPFFSYSPLFIVEKNRPLSGFCADIQNLLIDKLPEYNHHKFSAAVSRMIHNISEGRHIVMVGPVKGPGREKIMTFSIPMRVSFVSHIIIRAEDLEKLGGGPDLSLREMMSNSTLTYGRMRDAAHGPANDAILAEFPDHKRTEYIYGADALQRLILMLDKGRIDFLLWDPIVFGYNAEKMGYEGKFVAMPVRELKSTIEAGYIVVPKNAWGQKLIKQINGILREDILSGRMYKLQAKYISESFLDRFTKAYNKLVLEPAMED